MTTVHRRRGGIYIAVLGASMLVAILGLSALAAVAVERLTAEVTADMAATRYAAESGVDLALLTMKQQPGWRSTKPHGAWSSDVPVGGALVTVEVTDPADADLSNRQSDKVRITATATKGQARHIVQAEMQVEGDPIDAILNAVHTAGQFRVESGATLTVVDAPASTNATLSNGGTVDGDVECLLALPAGTINGKTTILSTLKGMPAAGVVNLYAGLGTVLPVGSDLERTALTPGRNIYSATTNPDGVYVIDAPSGLRIREARIWGTLVVRCPGQTVLIEKEVLFQRYRSDYPALIVDGNIVINMASGPLSEGGLGMNFNPAGAPYLGVSDSDQADSYPSQIEGLVHATGTIQILGPSTVVGAVVAESGALANAVYVNGTPRIEYDPTLATSPPIGYMKSQRMVLVPGSWQQITTP